MNKVILVGRLGADPELRTVKSGHSVTQLSVATNHHGRDGKKSTTWHRVTVWGPQAQRCCEFLAKGRQVLVEGRLENRTVDGARGKAYYTNVVASDVRFLGSRSSSRAQAGADNDPSDDLGDFDGSDD